MPERFKTSPGCFKCWLQRAPTKCVPTGLVEPVAGPVKTKLSWLCLPISQQVWDNASSEGWAQNFTFLLLPQDTER